MTGRVSVELKNGHVVSYDCYAATCYALEKMLKEEPVAVLGLFEKCLEQNEDQYQLTVLTLQKFRFVDTNEQIDPNVKEVALNSIRIQVKDGKKSVTLTSPIKRFI
jgi:hypothetical protein